MRCILFLLVLALAVPAVAAEEGESADPSSEPPSSEAGPSEDGSAQQGASSPVPDPEVPTCQAYQLNGFSRPVYGWVTFDPDGCYRRLLDRVIPPSVSVYLWMLP